MRGDTHVRFGGRARETDPGQPGHRARARPNRSDTAAIMPDALPSITAGQRPVPRSGTPQAAAAVVTDRYTVAALLGAGASAQR